MTTTPEQLSQLSLEEKREAVARLLRSKRPAQQSSSHPLSHGQQSLWLGQQLAPDSAVYNLNFAARVGGALDVSALRSSFQQLVERHAALRSAVAVEDGRPAQRVHARQEVSFTEVNCAQLGGPEFDALLDEDSRRPFDLASGPLLRVRLYTRGDGNVLLLTMHHLAGDYWSLALLLKELGALYTAATGGDAPALEPAHAEYGDFVRRQSELLDGPECSRLRDFWRRELPGEPRPLELPLSRPRLPERTYAGGARPFVLDEALTARLKTLAREEGTTLYVVLLTAFQTLLHRYTEQDEITVGTPTAGRDRPEFAHVLGYFVNPVALRADFAANPTVSEALARGRRRVLGALEHQDFPFSMLVELLQPKRDTSRPPVFQVMLTLERSPWPESQGASLFVTGHAGARLKLGALELESLGRLLPQSAEFDYTLTLEEAGGAVYGAWQYNSDLFDAPFIARSVEHFRRLLNEMATCPSERVSALSLLTSAERHQLVREWNDTAAPDPTPLLPLLLARLRSAPDAIALVRGDDHLSLSSLHARARALARRLRAAGTGPDSLVALCLSRSPAMVEALLGVLYSGAAYLPLDPEHPAERLALVLSDARPSVLVTERGLRPLVAACGATADGAAVIELDAEPEGEHDAHVPDAHTPAASLAFDSARALAYVIYTSGTTGRPKGVEVERRSLDLFLASMAHRPGLCSADVLLAVTTLSFDIAGLELWLPLREGARLELATEPEARDGARLAALLRERRVSMLQATPSTWRLLAQEWAGVSGAAAGLRALCGGEAWGSALAEALLAAGCAQVWNVYGPTETTIWSAARRVRRGERVVAAGGPLMRTQLYVLDGRGEVAPEGAWGQLWIGGGGLARGYRGRAELTAERFRPDGLSGECGGRVYQTGDVARVPGAGVVEVGGRGDEQVKVRGYRVELGEVEAALVRHGAVREGAAVVRAGVGGEMELVGYVVWAAGAGGGVGEGVGACGGVGATAVELREHMRVLVPEYMVPGRYVAVRELPLTPNGKLDRRALAAMTEVEPVAAGEYVAPRNYVEGELAKIWGGLLQAERVGREDDFFGLGGHSLLAAQMLSRVRSTFQVELTMTELFRSPKLASVAREITWRQAEQVGFETLSRLVAEIGQLTAEEAGAMLAAEA